MKREHYIESGGGGLPSGYRQLEYIQSNGNQFIVLDTSIGGKSNQVQWYVDVMYTDVTSSLDGNAGIIIANYSYNPRSYTGIFIVSNGLLDFQTGTTAAYVWYSNVNAINIRMTLLIDFSTGNISVNGNVEHTNIIDANMTNIPSTMPTTLFARYDNSSKTSIRMHAFAKLYECWIKVNNDFDVKLTPALRLSDNKPGLYDIVNDNFYTNQGTGEFLYA